MMRQYDLIVLGSGGAGYRVAMRCREAGWKVAVVESNKVWGGTCDNRGCIPKKIFVGAAELADLNRRFHEIKVVRELVEMDWGQLIAFKSTFTHSISDETKEPLEKAGVDLYEGSAVFIDDHTIDIQGEKLRSDYFHIAVGARPMELSLEGAEHVITSEDFLNLSAIPERIVFIGGGYVSFELAHLAARFGSKVTILHDNEHPLPAFDPDVVRVLTEASRDVGIEVKCNAAVTRVEKSEASLIVHTAAGQQHRTSLVINGAGRPPAIDTLHLDVAGITYERRGVVVNEYLQSVSRPHVYAGGDAAAAGLPLSPIARLHGTIVADNLLGKKTKQPDYRSTPSVVFTIPAIARVGLSEEEAKSGKYNVRVHTEDMSSWFDARRTNLKHTMSKVLIDTESNKIVGAHLMGNHAEDLINIFSLAIENGLTVEQLKAPIYAFPTASDDLRYML